MQGLDPDKGTGVGWRGLHGQGGDGQDEGTGRDVEESRLRRRGRDTETRGHRDERAQGDNLSMPKCGETQRDKETMGDSCRMDAKHSLQASPVGTAKVRWECLACLLLSWTQALTLAPELSLSHGL